MKLKSFFIAFILCVEVITSAYAQTFKNPELSISSIGKNRWIIQTTDNNTMYLVEGTKKALLIDTGNKCNQFDSIVRLITKKPLEVVLTHAHSDHTGNIDAFDEIYLHRADTVLLDKSYQGKLHFISDGDQLDLGGTILEVVHTPAHTPGSIVLMDKEVGYCYSGDAFGSGQVWLQLRPTAPMKTYIGSCEKMEKWLEKGIDSIYCGHYFYAKQAFSKEYITNMRILAESLENGTNLKGEPYPIIVSFGADHPMIITLGLAGIVYDPEHIK
ncbi:MAG: MBL fold metallo-hydrolase [Salinivirgaceae bacterium]|jgi:glyoxylase-like metal-dependent hydrolase (beta-lactamase superfamily II)